MLFIRSARATDVHRLAFLYLVALSAGHPLKLDRIRPEEFLSAMIESFDGQ